MPKSEVKEQIALPETQKIEPKKVEAPQPEEKPTSDLLSRIQGFLKNTENKVEEEVVKIEQKIEGKTADEINRIEKEKADKIKKDALEAKKNKKSHELNAKQKKRHEEKIARLNKLRKTYLIELGEESHEESYSKDKTKIIVPQEKFLNWSDRFESKELPAPPILDEFRGNDNKHIPRVLSAKEKIDILFETILNREVAAFNDAYKEIVNPDAYNNKGDTILTYSILFQRYPVITSVLIKGADPDLPNRLGHTPLDIAIEMIDLKAVQILLDMNADIDYVDEHNRTYLMHAARAGYLPIVQLLVESGADVNVSDVYGHTALSIAYRHKKEIIARYLLKNGAKAWIEKPYTPDKQRLIKDLQNRWKKPKLNAN